MTNKSNLIDRF